MADDRLDLLHRAGPLPHRDARAALSNRFCAKTASNSSPSATRSEEDIAFFAVLAQVEALDLVALCHAQTHDGVEHLEKDERSDDGNEDRSPRTDSLIDEL